MVSGFQLFSGFQTLLPLLVMEVQLPGTEQGCCCGVWRTKWPCSSFPLARNHNPQEPFLPRSRRLGADFNVFNISMGKGLPGGGGGRMEVVALLLGAAFRALRKEVPKTSRWVWVNVRLRMAPGICKSICTACSMIWSQFYLAGLLWNFSSLWNDL